MKQQYSILKNEDNTRLIIREYGELDKDFLSLLCEETYDDGAVSDAVAAGKEKVISVLRTKNMYPPRGHAEKIADSVIDFYVTEKLEPVDILIDEPAASSKEILTEAFMGIEEDESEIIDDLLEEDFEADSDDSDEIKLDSSIKIADDDAADVEDEL
jgi:hypothetical protein